MWLHIEIRRTAKKAWSFVAIIADISVLEGHEGAVFKSFLGQF